MLAHGVVLGQQKLVDASLAKQPAPRGALVERDDVARMLRYRHARQPASLRLEFKLLGMTPDDYDDWAGKKRPSGGVLSFTSFTKTRLGVQHQSVAIHRPARLSSQR